MSAFQKKHIRVATLISFFFFCFTCFFSQKICKSDKNLLIKFSCNTFSTFLGSVGQDEVRGVCRNNAGDVFVTGNTTSANMQATPGLIDDTLKGGSDAFAARFDSCGNLIWFTYIGSNQDDGGEKIVLCEDSTVVICGHSNGNDFPVSAGCYQPMNNGAYDAFVARLDFDGNVKWITYFGGNGGDLAYDITTDVHHNIYIGGSTSSTNLPTSPSSLQQNAGGSMDAFVSSFDAAGNFRWCTYFGGSGAEDVHVMCNDKSGDVYLGGGTFSNNINMGGGAWQIFNNGGMDAYIVKMDSSGNKLWSTYFGELGLDDCYGMVCDSAENLYISGLTNSASFPVTPPCYQAVKSLYTDMYLSKFSSSGNLMWSTFIGGNDQEDAKALSVNANQDITLFGRTMSTDMLTSGSPAQTSNNGNFDLFVTRCDSAGNFFYASYLGGNNEDDCYEIESNGTTCCYLGEASFSADFPVSAGCFQDTIGAANDGIIYKMQLPLNPTLNTSEISGNKLCVKLFPNPSSNVLFIQTNGEFIGHIQITDANGKTIIENNNCKSPFTEINTSALTSGCYYVHIKSGETSAHHKVLVLH